MVNKVFNTQIRGNLKVYVYDMITKSKEVKGNAADLCETSMTLRFHVMRFNPEKCVFGVTGAKCLGFLVDERGIEANHDKIQSNLDMQSPKSVKEVQKLNGCRAALGRFMSTSADKCSQFFKTLKKKAFEWSLEAKEAFQQLKKYLANLPKLVSPMGGEVLFLHVASFNYSVSAVLIAEREGKQFPIYNVSHAYRGAEANYSEIEKVTYVVVMASQKLKPYFESYHIRVWTSHFEEMFRREESILQNSCLV